MLLPFAEQTILDRKKWDSCLYVPGIVPLYFNFRSETKKYYFGTEMDETSQPMIALATEKQCNELKILELEFSESVGPHVFTVDYGINLAYRNMYNEKESSHYIFKQPFDEYAVAKYLLSKNFQGNSVWKKLADTWIEW